ncbi:MAG: hypothetical protein JWO02_4121 [Solirubrobacterales bacterium]|nr:hypothetical protein [Solirubrobacterales bacterium]
MVATDTSLTHGRLRWAPFVAPALAALIVAAHLHGVDLPAAVYRAELFRRYGLALWDSQWYGGHWTLNYSVIFPPVAGTLGIALTEVLSAGVAAWMFDRLVTARFGPQARAGSLLFALGTLAQVAIGQLPFLLGEALALAALWAMTGRRDRTALVLALGTSLASPLAGAFLALAAATCLIAAWPRRRLAHAALGGAAIVPVLALAIVFPGQGAMPFPASHFAILLVVFSAGLLAIPSRHRSLRIAAVLYLAAILVNYALPTAVGGNISRLGECVGAPLLTAVLWRQRRRLLVLIAGPMLFLQWAPALGSVVHNATDPSANAAYFQPVVAFLRAHDVPMGRVEVVPTALHWEAAYVAPFSPLARGWERQLDTADNPRFYDGTLTVARYRSWLLDNGVRYVALPDVTLDYAANREARFLRAGVPGLRPVWHNAHWRMYAVSGAPGILSGPGRLTKFGGSTIRLDVARPGRLLLRVRYSSYWTAGSQHACLTEAPGGWIAINALRTGRLSLRLKFDPGASDTCRAPAGQMT